MCKQPFDDSDVGQQTALEVVESSDSNHVTVRISNENDREIRVPLNQGGTWSQLKLSVALFLAENSEPGSQYDGVDRQISRVILFSHRIQVCHDGVVEPEHRMSISAAVIQQDWQDTINTLADNGHKRLAKELSRLAGNRTEDQLHDFQAALGLLCVDLLKPTATRGGTQNELDNDTDQEIIEVLLKAEGDGTSLHDALKSEFM
jgi:hypothetical protein